MPRKLMLARSLRRFSVTALLACALALAGCAGPIVRVSGNGRITPDLASAGNGGPVLAMTVPDGSAPKPDTPLVAVVDVDGLIINTDFVGLGSSGENPVSLFRERLDSIAANPCVRAVVVRINSPGGGVTATDIMWHDLMRFKRCTHLPVVACLMDVGAGGAYYLATAADEIVAHPTSVTGGIGVIINLYNLQDALQQFNIASAPVKSGDKIDIGSPLKAMDKSQRELLQKMADEFHDRFRNVVIGARPDVDGSDKTLFDGRVFTAREALDHRLIDATGYLDDAVCIARRLGQANCAQVVLFHRAADQAHSPYSITPNVPLAPGLIPFSLPGYDRTRLPGFLYLWQPEPTMERLSGK